MDGHFKITELPRVPDRPVGAHKGTFGTVIVVGGCVTMIGAPALCASAALRSGAGLVKLAVPQAVLAAAIGIEPGATGVILSQEVGETMDRLDEADPKNRAVLAVGPGMGQSKTSAELVARLLEGERPIVLDADGLNLLASSGRQQFKRAPKWVMTPHPGEFLRLAKSVGITADSKDASSRAEAAAGLAQAYRAVVVLKGHQTVVTDGQRVYVNPTGNPALATAGAGDVLTGCISGLMAQGMTRLEAAVLGVYLHGLAADRWVLRHGLSGLTARDLANELPDAFEQQRLVCR